MAKRLTMPTLKIRTQIILPFLLLMLILGLIGTYLTTSLVATSLENRIADQLVHAQDAALDAAVKLQGRQVAAVRLVANTEGRGTAPRWSPDGKVIYFTNCVEKDYGADCEILSAQL